MGMPLQEVDHGMEVPDVDHAMVRQSDGRPIKPGNAVDGRMKRVGQRGAHHAHNEEMGGVELGRSEKGEDGVGEHRRSGDPEKDAKATVPIFFFPSCGSPPS